MNVARYAMDLYGKRPLTTKKKKGEGMRAAGLSTPDF